MAPPLQNTRHMTLMGHGNVSLDIARLLLSSPRRIAPLDIPQRVQDIMAASQIEHISIVSRRGPAQVAFTAKELRELLQLEEVSMVPIDPQLLVKPPGATRQQSRILDLLRKGSVAKPGTTKKTWSLEFFRSPIRMLEGGAGIELGINELDSNERAVSTGQTETIYTDLVVNSVGYRSEPIVPEWFDEQLGRVRQNGSRVMTHDRKVIPKVYASGWAANGAKGVLATTMMDAYAVAERILEEALMPTADFAFNQDLPPEIASPTKRIVSYKDWKRIDAEEIRRGAAANKERERMSWTEVNQLLG